MSWSRRFTPPIALPGSGILKTLRDAADYIERLDPAEHRHPKVQAAIHVLLQAADHDGPMVFARMGVTAMLARHDPPKPPRVKRRRR